MSTPPGEIPGTPEGVRLAPGGEFDRIRQILSAAPLDGPDVLLGPGDDAAVLGGGPWAISVDMAVEEVHFRRDWLTGEEIAFRSVMAAMSDMAAMAAEPRAVLASIALPDGDEDFGAAMGRGLAEACSFLSVALIGGDLTRSPGPVVMDVVVLGRTGHAVERCGAEVGDEIWVTGLLGGAAAAVQQFDAGAGVSPILRAEFARPVPRILEARWLAERANLHGMIDLSDGLGGDATQLAASSGVRMSLDWASVPVHPEAEASLGDRVARELAVRGGEDYELCMVLPPGEGDVLAPEFRVKFGLPLTRVGWVEEGSGVRIVDPIGEGHTARGFDHFPGDENA
jgi:thiamine-monophosphate kinase